MKNKKLFHLNFKKIKGRIQKINREIKNNFNFFQDRPIVLLILTTGVVLIIIFFGFYFWRMIQKERLIMRQELDKALRQIERNGPGPIGEGEIISPETIFRLKESGVERYFLSKVENYDIIIHNCLFERGRPIYPSYVYGTWSFVFYPEKPPPEIALVKYLLLPEDSARFQPNRECFIREIKTERDWQEIGERYNFSRNQF